MKLIGALSCVLSAICIASVLGDYCDKSLCPPGKPHVACDNPTEKGKGVKCGAGAELIPIDAAFKAQVLKLHNEARAQVASGNLEGFPAASRMPQLEWDDTLASFAQLNARSCVYGHDKCHNTQKIKNGGQNIAYISSYENYDDPMTALESAISKQWFVEYKMASAADIDNYCDPNGKILHFLQMVNDKSTKVGCAVMRYPNPDKDNFKTSYVVCDYSYGNICGLPSYVKGDQCEGCTTGCSSRYAGLCKKNEKVDFYAENPMIQYW